MARRNHSSAKDVSVCDESAETGSFMIGLEILGGAEFRLVIGLKRMTSSSSAFGREEDSLCFSVFS